MIHTCDCRRFRFEVKVNGDRFPRDVFGLERPEEQQQSNGFSHTVESRSKSQSRGGGVDDVTVVSLRENDVCQMTVANPRKKNEETDDLPVHKGLEVYPEEIQVKIAIGNKYDAVICRLPWSATKLFSIFGTLGKFEHLPDIEKPNSVNRRRHEEDRNGAWRQTLTSRCEICVPVLCSFSFCVASGRP